MSSVTSRRTILGGVAGLGVSGLARHAWGHVVASGVTPVVRTTNGPVVGLVEDRIFAFRGLRYGAPPTGALRWTPPATPAPWTDPMPAVSFGPAAMQLSSGGGAVRYPGMIGPAMSQLMNSREDMIRQSEDCLFLNLWTPGLDNRARPVMVWFHGGGFNYGSGNWPTYSGHNLAKNHDVVLVSVTHRLNAFGYLNLARLGGHPSSGNAGMLDLVAALEWVRDNIAAFGGDPGNVTVFGQSGGGSKVSHTLAMPSADGLRHKAVIQSGAALRTGDPDRATEQARGLMKVLGVRDIAGLRAVPAHAIAAAVRDQGPGAGRWGPILDGVAIPAHPFEPVANPLARNVPVIVGVTSDEQTLYNVGFDWWGKQTEAQLLERLRGQYGPLAEPLLAAAKARYPRDDASYQFTNITSKGPFVASAALAERKAAQPAPVWMYVWEAATAAENGMMRAPHTAEIPYVFDNVALGPLLLGTTPGTLSLGRQASAAWTAFARYGDPNRARSGLPAWPRYDAARRATMVFNIKSRIENAPFEEFRTLLPALRPL